MAEISKIVECDFEPIYDKFLKDDDPRLSRPDWQCLFQKACNQISAPEFGYKLTHEGQIVGMLGMIQSIRTIDNRKVTFCNLHSWFVDEGHRANSISLLRPILKRKEWVITDYTPTPAVVQLSKRLGFQLLNADQRILTGTAKSTRSDKCQISWNNEIDLNRLQPEQLSIYHDHSGTNFQRALLETSNGSGLVVLRRVEFGRRPYASILYSSHPAVLACSQKAWQNEFRSVLGVNKIVLSKRHIGIEPVGATKITNEPNQMYRSSDIDPNKIDTLYSEVSMLGLSTLPSRKTVLKNTIKRLNPLNWIK